METSVEYFHSEVPEGSAGAWVIERVLIPQREYDPAADPRPDCFKFRPGFYTMLRREETQFMTDLYDEWWTQRAAIEQAVRRGGEVVITGLGLGLVAESILLHPLSRVERITIVELSPDVVRLVAPYLCSRYPGKVDVIESDAFTWQPPPGRRFTVGWHDIWPDPYKAENEGEINRLEQRYRSWCDWQGFWPRSYLEALSKH